MLPTACCVAKGEEDQIAQFGLDFIVIGVQKGGTTTLWDLLRDHPEVWLPSTKEAPFFSHTSVYELGLDRHLTRLGAPHGTGLRRGTVTPHYMHGWADAPTRVIASRIGRDLPRVKLVALLRDPIDRARSQHAMSWARGRDSRGAEQALREELDDAALSRARNVPDDCNTYIVQGEYGRILGEYLDALPRDALHVEWTDSLAHEPLRLLGRVERFLGVTDRWAPEQPTRRLFVGGRFARVGEQQIADLLSAIAERDSADAVAVTRGWLRDHAIDSPGTDDLLRAARRIDQAPRETRAYEIAGFRFFVSKTWNFRPSPVAEISLDLGRRLAAHYRADLAALKHVMETDPPWLERICGN